MSLDVLSVTVWGVLALVLFGYGFYLVIKGRKVDSYESAISLLYEVEAAVRVFAPAANQLVHLGELKEKERRAYVIEMVLDLVKGADVELIKGVIEVWVIENKERLAQQNPQTKPTE